MRTTQKKRVQHRSCTKHPAPHTHTRCIVPSPESALGVRAPHPHTSAAASHHCSEGLVQASGCPRPCPSPAGLAPGPPASMGCPADQPQAPRPLCRPRWVCLPQIQWDRDQSRNVQNSESLGRVWQITCRVSRGCAERLCLSPRQLEAVCVGGDSGVGRGPQGCGVHTPWQLLGPQGSPRDPGRLVEGTWLSRGHWSLGRTRPKSWPCDSELSQHYGLV